MHTEAHAVLRKGANPYGTRILGRGSDDICCFVPGGAHLGVTSSGKQLTPQRRDPLKKIRKLEVMV